MLEISHRPTKPLSRSSPQPQIITMLPSACPIWRNNQEDCGHGDWDLWAKNTRKKQKTALVTYQKSPVKVRTSQMIAGSG
ncbi:hypothetical protein chiPu_0006581 [Chiloscyllium punctatum]|uniref:Uncharacterized protein n=1 Tax=Chiloscyllium punctatum TaxID=137246 RepID=A0A401SCT0_CHIPU|nr:hypothetical protein [Chiloscyllium punctatum]